MDLDHLIRSQPVIAYNVQPVPIVAAVAAIAAIAVIALSALIFLIFLRYRVSCLGAQLATRETAMGKLTAELEAQALLARQMSLDVEELRKRLFEREEIGREPVSLWASAGLPVNLNRHGQILRLSRKGKSIAEIAHDLNVAQGEVELLLKVHDLTQKTPSG